ncbi:hypothetical protein, partial [Novosphingobium resinovorum]|uniref:hypothetical protein n=1 Tax=Novosphingobium resinovorum TaxID=158500 RepID=UPI002ED0F340|nr:hypothetical protein [Novosphingobium resinovorum]
RACPPSDRPSLTEYQDLRQTNALIAVGAYQSRISNFCQSSARVDRHSKPTRQSYRHPELVSGSILQHGPMRQFTERRWRVVIPATTPIGMMDPETSSG